MKSVALFIALVLHVTGLWPHVPESSRQTLTTAATGTVAEPKSDVAYSGQTGPLAVRTGDEVLHLTAAGAIAIDATTGTVLYAQDPDKQLPLASISKLITTVVVLADHQPSDPITVPTLPKYDPAAELIGLLPGEKFAYGDIIEGALINSGNDAADTLAIASAGSTTKFAARMNAKMAQWGIGGTRFSSPSGLQDTDNYASAAALAKIAQLALTNQFIKTTVAKSEATITSDKGRVFNLESTNKLLATGRFYGIKTGYTPAAGECFVGLTRIQGHEVITVVLGSNDRFGVSQTLANWIDRNWQWL